MTFSELGQHLRAPLQYAGPRPQSLHYADSREAWLVVHKQQHRKHSGAQAIAPARLVRVSFADKRADLLDGLIEHCEEAILPILEEVVERLAGHPRPCNHLRNGEAGITNLLDRLRGRRQHATALDLRHLSTRDAVSAGT